MLKGRKNALPIELLFLDGEEAVVEWNTGNDNTYGSRYYVEAARKAGTLPADPGADPRRHDRRPRPAHHARAELDAVADRHHLGRGEAAEAAASSSSAKPPIEDDHLPFLEAGVPAVDIIDLDYPAWHTADDTLDKVSAGSCRRSATCCSPRCRRSRSGC